MNRMTDGIAWLAGPQSITWGGYSIVMTPDLGAEELVARLAQAAGPARTAHPVGMLTGEQLTDRLDDDYGDILNAIALRYGQNDRGWSFAVKYGFWPGQFTSGPPISRDGARVFELEYEEENGKPVPPQFTYMHGEQLMCAFNLHLDHSWGYDGVDGDPETASRIEEALTAAGLPAHPGPDDEDADIDDIHPACLHVIEQQYGLTLPRTRILHEALPAVDLGPV